MDKEHYNHPVKYVQMMSSSAHTYGNAVAFIQKWLIDLFPKRDNGESIFRSINVSSKIAHRQIRRTPNEISKNTKPILMIRPRVDFQEDRFLDGIALTNRILYTSLNYSPEVLQPFFFDSKNKISIKYQMNRTVMYIDTIMVFPTLIQQLDYVTYLRNKLPIADPFYLDTCFESYIAPEMIEMLANLAGIPIEKEGSIKPLLNYLNSNSNCPVTYKLQGSTNTREFYRYYPVKIITTIPSIDMDDGEKTGQVNDNYQIQFSVKIEFFSTGFYFLFSDRVHDIGHPSLPDNSSIIPIFTDVLLREDWDIREGWSQYNRASCVLSEERDTVNFKEMLSPSIVAAVKHYIEKGYLIDEFLDIRVREQGRMMSKGTEYFIDYRDFSIHFNNKQFGFLTYTIMIMINPEVINNLIKDIFKLK